MLSAMRYSSKEKRQQIYSLLTKLTID